MGYNVIIQCSYNTAIVFITDGEKIVYANENKLELYPHKEQNRQIASNLAKECIDKLLFYGVTRVPITVRGPQVDVRTAFIDTFMNSEIELTFIKDITPIPHNIFKQHTIDKVLKKCAITKR